MKVVKRLDSDQLPYVLIEEGYPVIRWYYDCAFWCTYNLGGVDVSRGVDDISKVSQSTNLCASVSVQECVSVALLKQSLSYLFFRRPKHQSGENFCVASYHER